MPQQQFKGYSQDQMGRIASKLGHTGGLDTFDNYLNSNPSAFSKYNALKDTITQHYARGGMVKSGYDAGGLVQQMFQSNLNRYAGQEALNYYADQAQQMLNAGATEDEVKRTIGGELSRSEEGKQRTEEVAAGNVDFQRYVSKENQVQPVVRPDLPPGMARTMVETPMLQYNTANEDIQRAYKNSLGRSAGSAGMDNYSQQMTDGVRLSDIQAEIAGSTEAKNYTNTGQQRYVSEDKQIEGEIGRYNPTDKPIDALGRTGDNTAADAAALQTIYQNQTGRAAGTEGFNTYQNLLNTGTNLDTIRGQIYNSDEAAKYRKTGQQEYVGVDNRIDGVKYNEVGTGNIPTPPVPNPSDGTAQPTAGKSLGDIVAGRATAPGLVAGASATATGTTTGDNQILNSADSKLEDTSAVTNKDAALMKASSPTVTSANTATTEKTKTLADTDAAQSSVPEKALVTAQTQATTNVGAIDAAQSSAIQVDGAPTRTLQTGADGKSGELVNPVADAQKAAAFTEQITAAQGDPSSRATVQGQLATLMTSFDEGKTPAWAAGAMRNVTAQMSARGIGSSSMAGQALIQAALEASLPIATADAQTFATFEMTNLNNRQQRVMLAAQQRATFMGQEFDQAFQSRVLNSNKISEVANMRFTGDQQIALENSQAANTMQLNNLSNKQAIVMASASTMSQLEVTSLNNRQQAEVQNAQSFLDMDMSNLSNTQQATMFDAQSRVQAMLTDAAAENATQQFNASSKNQTDQFFEGLKSQISQFNASQSNAQAQFNTGETNTIAKFNKEISNQRDQFNAQNRIVIDQSNAQWRRDIATADTVSTNRANEINAKSVLDISNSAYNDLWQDYRDKTEWAFSSAESGRERFTNMALQRMSSDASITVAQIEADYKTSVSAGEGLAKLLFGDISGTFVESLNIF